jgi:hypothetical protein
MPHKYQCAIKCLTVIPSCIGESSRRHQLAKLRFDALLARARAAVMISHAKATGKVFSAVEFAPVRADCRTLSGPMCQAAMRKRLRANPYAQTSICK